MKLISILFWVSLVLISLARVFTSEDGQTKLLHVSSEYQIEIQEIDDLLKRGSDETAMLLITALLDKITTEQNSLLVWLHSQQAQIHSNRQHYHYAIDSLKQASLLLKNPRYIEKRISHLQAIIDRQQKERTLNDSYSNSRNSGIAKRLKNDVTIAYIYLDDNKWSKWSAKLRQKNRFNISQITDWYKKQADDYDVANLNIDVRYFYVRSPKGLAKNWLREPEFFKYAQNLVSQQMGYANFEGFTNELTNGDPNHHVALVFHSNNQARSFAMSCPNIRSSHCRFEYAMLTEKMNHNAFSWATQQVQSHEILHLFGASDLYNIKAAKDYAVTDLMNYYSQELKYATIEPITAWAIGWANLPKTPFNVEPTQD